MDFFRGPTIMSSYAFGISRLEVFSIKYLNRTLETKNAWNLIDMENIIMSDDAKDSSYKFLEYGSSI